MERLPRIIFITIATTALFLWISSAFTACGEKDLVSDTTELVSNTADSAEDFADDLGDDIFGDDSDDDMFITDDNDYEDDDYEEDYYVEGDEAVETDFTEPVSEPKQTYTPAPTKTYSSGGEYMVIAGNYLVESNAREMTTKLSNLGYSNAEIGVFERSQYHTVIASRHSSNSSAIQTANALRNRGVDCYVKRKTY